jgi:hypothetical protein
MTQRYGKTLGVIATLLILGLLILVFYVAAQKVYIPGTAQSVAPVHVDNYGESAGGWATFA